MNFGALTETLEEATKEVSENVNGSIFALIITHTANAERYVLANCTDKAKKELGMACNMALIAFGAISENEEVKYDS